LLIQGIYDKRQRTEVEMAKRDQELKQLQGWRSTVQSLLERFQELVAQQAAAVQAAAANGTADDAPATEQAEKTDAGASLAPAHPYVMKHSRPPMDMDRDRPASSASSSRITASVADRESAAAAAEEGRSLYDANGNIDAQAFHAELAKQAAAAQTSQQESTLQKLRQHFQRVGVVACSLPYSLQFDGLFPQCDCHACDVPAKHAPATQQLTLQEADRLHEDTIAAVLLL
jgi:hypothetical protein